MDTHNILEDIGLSPTERKIFLVLLELGESKAGRVIEKSGLQSSSTYNAINSLISKGLVSYIKKSEVKYYRAADPEAVLDYLDSKKKEYLKILPSLKNKQNQKSNDQVEFFKSYKGIRILMSKFVKGAKKGDIYRTFAVEDPVAYQKAKDNAFGFLKLLLGERKVSSRGIFHEKTRKKKKKSTTMDKRYVDFPLPPNTLILNNQIAIIDFSEDEPSGILIHSVSLARKYSEFFDSMWKLGKK